LGPFGIAVVQDAYIMSGTALLSGVDWGNPFLAGLLLTQGAFLLQRSLNRPL
jgi:ABC-2 type transport system permease protein